jgi:large subunit ribosomal protein L19
MQHKLRQLVEAKQLRSDVPVFQVGDTIIVHQRLLDGQKERIQTFEGDVIARSGFGVREMMTVRKIVQGEGVERMFPIHSPRIAKIEVKKAGSVRRAKLYYIRDRVGKAVKIKLDVKRQELLDKATALAVQEAAAAKAAAAKEQTATTGESKRAAKRKAKAEAAKK